MSGVVRSRAGARRDLVTTYRQYVREASVRTADRFLARADAPFRRLADLPGLGTRCESEETALQDLRFMPLLHPFRKYLVFYRPIAGGVEIVRVLHGARDLDGVLAGEFADDPGPEDQADGGESP